MRISLVGAVLLLGSVLAVGFLISSAIAQSGNTCPPPPAGANGCQCTPFACGGGAAQASPCLSGWCFSNSDCYNSSTPDGYWIMQVAIPTQCSSTGPLVGGGCQSAAEQSLCKAKYFCDCDFDFGCQGEFVQAESYYIPCTQR